MNRGEQMKLLSAPESLEISAGSIHALLPNEVGGASRESVGRYGSVTASADTIQINNLPPLKQSSSSGGSAQGMTNAREHHHGTLRQTVLNISKACAGTGTLALPYAAAQGGYLFNIAGLVLMSCWNIYSVSTLCKCRELIPAASASNGSAEDSDRGKKGQSSESVPSSGGSSQRCRRTRSNMQKMFKVLVDDQVDFEESEADEREKYPEKPPPEGTATYGRAAWYAFGPVGLHSLDTIMVVLLCGIVIAYQDALISFIRDTPFTTGSAAFDSIWTVLIIAPLSCVPDLSYLSRCSALGIFAIFVTFFVIFCYGVVENGFLAGFREISWTDLWPQGFTGVGNWFGIVAFGFGVTPIAYNIQESMEHPERMPHATKLALLTVCGAYVVISDGVAVLLRPSVPHFEGDVLHELPESWIPTMIRLAMAFVVLVTVPLLVVPCAELIEGKMGMNAASPLASRLTLRFSLCLVCSGTASCIPGFVHVISFIGAFCMSLTSFVFPPLMHIALLKRHQDEEDEERCSTSQPFLSSNELERFGSDELEKMRDRRAIQVDSALLVCGIFATVFASFLTFSDLLHNAER